MLFITISCRYDATNDLRQVVDILIYSKLQPLAAVNMCNFK